MKFEDLSFDSSWGIRIFSLTHARDKTEKKNFLTKKDVIYFVMKSKKRNRIFRALMLYRSDTETLIFSGQAHSLGL